MTAVTIRDRLEPLIGESGSIFMVVSSIVPFWFATVENKKLTGVEIQPDGLLRLERESGWAVIDPGEIVALGWNGDMETHARPVPLSARVRPGLGSLIERYPPARRGATAGPSAWPLLHPVTWGWRLADAEASQRASGAGAAGRCTAGGPACTSMQAR